MTRPKAALPVVGITMGDFNGIGPEIALRAAQESRTRRLCSPILVGSVEVFAWYAKKLRMSVHLHEVDALPAQPRRDSLPVLSLHKFSIPAISPGRFSSEAGMYAGEAIERAAQECLGGALDAMVTAPVSKQAMNAGGYRFPGQTEMLAHLCGGSPVLMMLVAGAFRVALVTVHLPMKKVPSAITQERIIDTATLLAASLRKDFRIATPSIAVLGLNPHAGEQGMIGSEEQDVIIPAMRRLKRRKGMNVLGPYPADGFFGIGLEEEFDAVLAMYHDQGLIPLKMHGFTIGVNYSAGLPIVRTSPDHGTAFDLAGKGTADPGSMYEAIHLAVTISHNRSVKR